MTAVLNARLIGLTHGLIGKAQDALVRLGVQAPLMVVRGDGALMSAEQAQARPIETILSGPAASLVGARWLTGASDALVSDIGGTTTDIALLRKGRPAIDGQGARVGPYRTMVEAVAMRTHGLGGDSEVSMAPGLESGVVLGPRRVVPVALMGSEDGAVVEALEGQLRQSTPGEHDGRFVRQVQIDPGGLLAKEAALLGRVSGVRPLAEVVRNRLEGSILMRLRSRGIVQVGGLTPSDAAHVLGHTDVWNVEAAQLALALMARRRAGSGMPLAPSAEALAQMIESELQRRTGLALLEAAFSEEGFHEDPAVLADHVLMQRGLDGHRGLVRLSTGLDVPVVGLGASAATYYPAVGQRLGCEMQLPAHGGVANAIGAVVGRVRVRREGMVTAPAEGRYRAHLEAGPQDFDNAEGALAALETALRALAEAEAFAAGARDVRSTAHVETRRARLEAREVFVEAVIRVEASGRPPLNV